MLHGLHAAAEDAPVGRAVSAWSTRVGEGIRGEGVKGLASGQCRSDEPLDRWSVFQVLAVPQEERTCQQREAEGQAGEALDIVRRPASPELP